MQKTSRFVRLDFLSLWYSKSNRFVCVCVYSSVGFNTCIDSCTYLHNQGTQQSHHPRSSSMLSLYSASFPCPITPGNHRSDLHHCDLPFWECSWWNHRLYQLLSPVSTQHNALEIHQIVACIMNRSFLFRAGQYSIIWIYHSLLIQSLVERHLGCFQSGLLWIGLLLTFVCRFLCDRKLSFF